MSFGLLCYVLHYSTNLLLRFFWIIIVNMLYVHKALGMDHFIFEGGGGVGQFLLGKNIFFRLWAVHEFFLVPKGCARIFFSIFFSLHI